MSPLLLADTLRLLHPFLVSSRLQIWEALLQTSRLISRKFLQLWCGLVLRLWCKPPPSRPSSPDGPHMHEERLEGKVHPKSGSTKYTSTFPSTPYTVVLHGETIPLNNALFSTQFNPTPQSAGDSFRGYTPFALSLPERQQRSQISLSGRSGHSNLSVNTVRSHTPSPSPSLHPARRETGPLHIEVVKADDNTTSDHASASHPVHSDEPEVIPDTVGQHHGSTTLEVPGRKTPAASLYSSTSSMKPNLHDHQIYSTLPSDTKRYGHRKKIDKIDTDILLTPEDCSTEHLLRDVKVPAGWQRLAHPEGGCYFYNAASRVYTDNEIFDPEELRKIMAQIEIVEECKAATPNFPPKAYVVLNKYTGDPDETHCYFVNPDDRIIFFPSHYWARWIPSWATVKGAYSRYHLRLELEAEYWKFVHLYPHSTELSQIIIDELKDILFFYSGDVTTSVYSTSPYNSSEITNILNALPLLERHVNSESSTSGSVEFIARIMYLIAHNRFLNFFGEPCARLERDFSIYGDALFPRSLFLKVISPFLFSAPDVHLGNLQRLWADKMVHQGVWKDIMGRFSSEWQELITYATIMLNANVAFLAIQSVDNTVAPSRSSAQIFSYASTVANLACMILALLLLRQNRTKPRETSDKIYDYVSRHDSSLIGLEGLAIMYSLPHAALMWGMICFFAAFSLMCLTKADAQTRTVVGSCLTLTVLYIAWCIYLNWEENPDDTSQEDRTLSFSQKAELEMANGHAMEGIERRTLEDAQQSGGDSFSRECPTQQSSSIQFAPGLRRVIKAALNFFRFVLLRQSPAGTENEDVELHSMSRSSRNRESIA